MIASARLNFIFVLFIFCAFLAIESRIACVYYNSLPCGILSAGQAILRGNTTPCNVLSELCGFRCKILLNHKGNLEGYCVVKFTKIKAGKLSDLLKTVNEGVSMYEELS